MFGRILGALLIAAPATAVAQRSTGIRRIGRLEPGARDSPEEIRKAEWALRELGWVEGRNLHIERRHANGQAGALKDLAEELIRAKVEVIVAGGTAATLAAKHATTTVPIVFRSAGDPVLLGLVASLARPGGNVTGFSRSGPEITAKYLSLAKELLPAVQRIGVLEPSSSPYYRAARRHFEIACRALGLRPLFAEFAAAGEIEGAIADVARQQADVLLLPADSAIWDNRFEIAAVARKHRLPTIAEHTEIVREGGVLISYSMTQEEEDRRAASYVDRILRGARPADLPVEQPTIFRLVINMKTAKALGLTIPQAMLLRADEVIQ